MAGNKMKNFRYFLLATTMVIFLLVVMGNVVRVSDAAKACPDWPTCFGQFSFPAQAPGSAAGSSPRSGSPVYAVDCDRGSLGGPRAGLLA